MALRLLRANRLAGGSEWEGMRFQRALTSDELEGVGEKSPRQERGRREALFAERTGKVASASRMGADRQWLVRGQQRVVVRFKTHG